MATGIGTGTCVGVGIGINGIGRLVTSSRQVDSVVAAFSLPRDGGGGHDRIVAQIHIERVVVIVLVLDATVLMIMMMMMVVMLV